MQRAAAVISLFAEQKNYSGYRTMTFARFFGVLVLAVFLHANSLQADVFLGTDFEGTTENGMTLEDVAYVTNGLATVPTSFSNLTVNNTNQAQGNGILFTTGAADGSFAVANNTGNGGIWNFMIDFTVGAMDLELKDFNFGWRNFGGNGNNQFALRNTTVTIDILQGMTSAIGGQQVFVTPTVNTGNGTGSQNNPPSAGTQFSTIGLTGLGTLTAGTTYTFFFQASDATTVGNNFGVDEFSIHANPVPEPGSAIVLGLAGLIAFRRRRV